jgi:hypothetical protein
VAQEAAPAPLVLDIDEALAVPQYDPAAPNGYVEFEKLVAEPRPEGESLSVYDLSDTLPGKSGEAPEPADVEAALELIEANRELLQGLVPLLEMEWLYPREPTPETLYSETSRARQLAYLLALEAVVEAHVGRPEQAIEPLLTALRLGVKFGRGGAFMPWVTGISCQTIALRELGWLVGQHRLRPDTLQAISAALEELEPQRPPLRETIARTYQEQGPAALTLSAKMFWELLGGPPQTFLPLDSPEADKIAHDFIRQRLPPLREYDGALAALATRPYYEIRDQIPDVPDGLRGGSYLVLTPVGSRTLEHEATTLCHWRAVRAMAHLELAWQEAGRYPQSLAELAGLSRKELQDPFSGESLLYRRAGDGYLLYSAGLNGIDNGGEPGGHAGHAPDSDWVLWDSRAD